MNLVNGGREAVDAILDHPIIRSVSFVGSSAVARHVYSRGAAAGKRVQCQGGAKNPVIVMPDADMAAASEIIADSAFGCAGQRCLASSFAVAVGDASQSFTEAIGERAAGRVTGYGLDDGVQMGPVISAESRSRIESAHRPGDSRRRAARRRRPAAGDPEVSCRALRAADGARGPADRKRRGTNRDLRPGALSPPRSTDIDAAIRLVNSGAYGNQACLFTTSGANARKFRYEAEVGNVGINVGVAAPMAYFPFSGARESFFGDLHGQGRDAFEFFTQEKVVVERWPKEWTRKF